MMMLAGTSTVRLTQRVPQLERQPLVQLAERTSVQLLKARATSRGCAGGRPLAVRRSLAATPSASHGGTCASKQLCAQYLVQFS